MASQFRTGALLQLGVLLDSYNDDLTSSTARGVLKTGRITGKTQSSEVVEAAHGNLRVEGRHRPSEGEIHPVQSIVWITLSGCEISGGVVVRFGPPNFNSWLIPFGIHTDLRTSSLNLLLVNGGTWSSRSLKGEPAADTSDSNGKKIVQYYHVTRLQVRSLGSVSSSRPETWACVRCCVVAVG